MCWLWATRRRQGRASGCDEAVGADKRRVAAVIPRRQRPRHSDGVRRPGGRRGPVARGEGGGDPLPALGHIICRTCPTSMIGRSTRRDGTASPRDRSRATRTRWPGTDRRRGYRTPMPHAHMRTEPSIHARLRRRRREGARRGRRGAGPGFDPGSAVSDRVVLLPVCLRL